MGFRLGLQGVGYPKGADVEGQLAQACEEAAAAGCDVVVFPENHMCPVPMSIEGLREIAEPIDGPFVTLARSVARRLTLTLVICLIEKNGNAAPYNTGVVISETGQILGSYRKCHLYDAHGARESDRLTAGDELFRPVKTKHTTLGLGICYDLRFPELARAQALAGAEVLVFPAAWHKGPEKREHWEGLLRARAIENEVFCCGCGHADEPYLGESLIVDPLGRVIAQGPEAEGQSRLVWADIDPKAVEAARDAMPCLSHRRPELYGPLVEGSPA